MPLQSTLANQGKGLCLLSLDAGGRRSISQLKILAELMHRLNFDVPEDQKLLPCDVFDMIGGSGSGGFIAILHVILGLTAEQAFDEFIEFSVNIMEKQGVDAEARTTELKIYIDRLLEKYDVEKDMRLLDRRDGSKGCRIVIPILHKRHLGHARILRNFDASQDEALNFTISEAILATLASLPLFMPASILSGTSTFEYISGDLTLSNPTRLIVSEAYEALGGERRVACLLSIGCGHPGVIITPENSDFESWNPFLENIVRDNEQRAEEIESQMGHLGLYHRFSVTRGLEMEQDVPVAQVGDTIAHATVYLTGVSVSRKVAMCVDSLKVRDGAASLEQLTHSGGHRVDPPTLPPLTRTFVMRKGPWEFIENAIFGAGEASGTEGPKMLAVTGMGGCGKTQIVLKFLRVRRHRFELCLFVDGSSAPHIRADVVRHIRSLDVAHSQKSFEECLRFLSRSSLAGQRVIVYDSVDDPAIDLAPLLPTGESCAIVVTSRNRLIGDLCPGSHLELDVMSMEEAIELLLYSTGRSTTTTEESRGEARAIAEALGCLPIALQQARSYMSQTKCSAKAYLERLVANKEKLLAEPTKFQLDMAAVSTYAAFETSFKKLPLGSQKFLRLLSYFHWDKFPLELVILGAKYNFSEYRLRYTEHGEDFEEGKAVLEDIFLRNGEWRIMHLDKLMVDVQNFSLITPIPGVDTTLVEMHPLAHSWLQSCIPERDAAPYQSAAILLLALGSRNEYTPSAQYLASHISHMYTLWDQLHVNNAEAFADILDTGGRLDDALKIRQRVAAELRGQAEPDSMNIANSSWALALSYKSLGRAQDAEPLQREALRLLTQILGGRHPHAIMASSNLAVTYSDLGRLKDAVVLHVEVLKLRKEILGERHPDTITASGNLANTYHAMGRLKDAEMLDEEVLKLMKEMLGKHHPNTVTAYNNLANTYYALGRPKDAKVLQEEVLKIRKKILGERHPDTVTASSNLALTYRDLGWLKDAEVLLEGVLTLRKEILGEHHPDTITDSDNLACTYRVVGRLKEAEALQLETVRQAKNLLGNEHPTTAHLMLTMAEINESLHKKTEALALLDLAEPIIAEKQGRDHPQYVRSQKIRARVHALVDPPFHATFPNPGTENAARDTPSPSQNAPRRSLHSGVRRLLARVRDRLSWE